MLTSHFLVFIAANQDHVVRPKFQHLLDSSYRPFSFADLPVELRLRILSYATTCSQGTYRSLLLTNKRISDLIRIEMLSGVAVILTSERQVRAFKFYLQQRPEVIPHIRALWAIIPSSFKRLNRVFVDIVTTCTGLRSLACHARTLLLAICRKPALIHTHLVDLTVIEFRVSWQAVMHLTTAAQLERLHFIGPLDWPSPVVPKLNNLTRVSIAMGSHKTIPGHVFTEMVKSPELQQVVITTRLQGADQQSLSNAAQEIDGRFSVLHRRRRWK